MAHVYRVCVVYTKELFSNITGICILHGRATLDDPMFSPDHPALSFGNLWFACVSSVFFSYPISTNVFSVTGVSHFHPGMDQKLAVSTFPTHELHQNIMVFNCGWKAMKNKHKGNS